LLSKEGIAKAQINKYSFDKIKFLDDLYTPPSNPISVVNNSEQYQNVTALNFKFRIASEKNITDAILYIKEVGWRGFDKFPLKHTFGLDYSYSDSSQKIKSGKIQYCVSVKTDDQVYTFPSEIKASPDNWDFYTDILWNTEVLKFGETICLFDASRDKEDFVFPHFSPDLRYNLNYQNGTCCGNSSLSVGVTYSKENKNGFAVQLSIAGINSMKSIMNEYGYVIVRARSVNETKIGLNFLSEDGKNFGAALELSKEWKDIELPVTSFRPQSALILPSSYPLFLSGIWKSTGCNENSFKDFSKLQFIQITCDKQETESSNFEIESIYIKK